MIKKSIILIMVLIFCEKSSHAVIFMGKNPKCSSDEKISETKAEKIMRGDFETQFTLDFMNAMPKDEFITVRQHDNSYKLLCENALALIAIRRTALGEDINKYYSSLDDKYYSSLDDNSNNKGLIAYLYSIFFYYFTRLVDSNDCNSDSSNNSITMDFLDEEGHYDNLVKAYNILTVMKKRLERVDSKEKRLLLMHLFEQQKGDMDTTWGEEKLPKEIIATALHHINMKPQGITISLRDLVLAVLWSPKDCGWLESYPPQVSFKLEAISNNCHVSGEMGTALYRIIMHWKQMYKKDWIRCTSGKRKQPVYIHHNFIKSEIGIYQEPFSPYFREVLDVNDPQCGAWWHSYALPSDEQKTGTKGRVLWLKFPFEPDYDSTQKGRYNPKKNSRYQFEDGTVMDSEDNPYLDKKTNRKRKSFETGSTAKDATWVLQSDAKSIIPLYKSQ